MVQLIGERISTYLQGSSYIVGWQDKGMILFSSHTNDSISLARVEAATGVVSFNAEEHTWVSHPAGSSPIDLAITSDGKFLYAIDGGTGSVSTWSLSAKPKLLFKKTTPITHINGIVGLNGIAIV